MTAGAIPRTVVPWRAWARAAGSWAADLSPSGRVVAYVSDRVGLPRAHVQAVGRVGLARELPLPSEEHVLDLAWSPDGAWIACLGAQVGMATRTRIWLARPDGSEVRCLSESALGTATFSPWLRTAPILPVTTSGQGPEECASYLLDPRTGQASAVTGTGGLVVDASPDGRRALVRSGLRGRRALMVVDVATGSRRPLLSARRQSLGRTDFGCFLPDGSVLARTDVGSDLAALVRVHGRGRARTIAARSDAELDGFCVSGDGTRAALVWNMQGHSEVELLEVRDETRRPVTLAAGVSVVDRVRLSGDGGALVVCGSGPATPPGVWVTRLSPPWRTLAPPRPTRPPQRADRPAPRLTRAALVVQPNREALTSFDGTRIAGWLYEPRGRTGAVGTVIYLHGGPEAEERPAFAPLFQSLVAAGLAVFAPNVRGSTGHGRAFELADEGARRFDAIRDVAACVRHLERAGIAAPGRIGCMGRSYGGYLTMAALTFHPELFAAGVSVCGMSDLPAFFAETEPWVASVATGKYGDPATDARLLAELSPLRRFDRLRAPLLFVHGLHDRNVPVGESERAHAEARRRGVPTAYLRFSDEGHEIARPANRERLVRAATAWFARHLSAESAALEPLATAASA